ncbi:MAG: dihydroneopterin aldolase [Balneolales bacterium]
MDTITLKNLYFLAKHGYHDFERVKGNEFEVDVIFSLSLIQPGESDDLSQTIDYSEVYDIVQGIMIGESVKLIEALVDKIGNRLIKAYPTAIRIKVNVRKLNPPLSGPCAYSEISRTWQKSS